MLTATQDTVDGLTLALELLAGAVKRSGLDFPELRNAEALVAIARRPAAVDLVATMKRIEPGAARGALVGARDLRNAAGMTKAKFDAEALRLGRAGVLSLHPHDYPSSLTPADRDVLVTDGKGTFYVGMAIRKS